MCIDFWGNYNSKLWNGQKQKRPLDLNIPITTTTTKTETLSYPSAYRGHFLEKIKVNLQHKTKSPESRTLSNREPLPLSKIRPYSRDWLLCLHGSESSTCVLFCRIFENKFMFMFTFLVLCWVHSYKKLSLNSKIFNSRVIIPKKLNHIWTWFRWWFFELKI